MRIKFVQTENAKDARKSCPWQSRIMKVCGGYMCFESIEDYKTWKNQK